MKCRMPALTERETFVIKERYENGKTRREVAEELDLPINYLRQIEAKALKKMQKFSIDKESAE